MSTRVGAETGGRNGRPGLLRRVVTGTVSTDRYRWLLAVWVIAGSQSVWSTTYTGRPDNYTRLVRNLLPGDVLKLESGIYRQGLRVHGLNGAPGQPIVIEGPSPPGVAVFFGRPGRNIVSIRDASHIVLRRLEIDGQGAFVDAVKAEGDAHFAHHITLEGLDIHNLGMHQQTVGISTKCPAWDWEIRDSRIDGAGTGMYFGDSDGSAPFVGGLIENNQVSDSIGYSLQIKHQVKRSTVAGMPTGQRVTVIRRNRFVKGEGSARGGHARPNVLVGHFPPEGPGSEDLYLIEKNLFLHNPAEALFQGEGHIALCHNIFYNGYDVSVAAVNIQPHNDIPRRVHVASNAIVHPHAGIRLRLGPGSERYAQTIRANLVLAGTPVSGVDRSGNRTAGFDRVPACSPASTGGPPDASLVVCEQHLRAIMQGYGGTGWNGWMTGPGSVVAEGNRDADGDVAGAWEHCRDPDAGLSTDH